MRRHGHPSNNGAPRYAFGNGGMMMMPSRNASSSFQASSESPPKACPLGSPSEEEPIHKGSKRKAIVDSDSEEDKSAGSLAVPTIGLSSSLRPARVGDFGIGRPSGALLLPSRGDDTVSSLDRTRPSVSWASDFSVQSPFAPSTSTTSLQASEPFQGSQLPRKFPSFGGLNFEPLVPPRFPRFGGLESENDKSRCSTPSFGFGAAFGSSIGSFSMTQVPVNQAAGGKTDALFEPSPSLATSSVDKPEPDGAAVNDDEPTTEPAAEPV